MENKRLISNSSGDLNPEKRRRSARGEKKVVTIDVESMDTHESPQDKSPNKEVGDNVVTNNKSSTEVGNVSRNVKEARDSSVKTTVPCYVPEDRRNTCFFKSCKFVAPSSIDLLDHVIKLHPLLARFNCSHCTYNASLIELVDHLSMHGNTMFQCKHCRFYSSSRVAVREHIKVKHLGSEIVVVKVRALDSEDFSPEDQLLEKVWSKMSPAEIEQRKAQLKKNWQCGLCDFNGPRNDMIKHAKTAHDIEDQFKCTLCSIRINRHFYVDNHCSTCHPDTVVTLVAFFYIIDSTLPFQRIKVIMPDGQDIFSPEKPVFVHKKPKTPLKEHFDGKDIEEICKTESSKDDTNEATVNRVNGSTLQNRETKENRINERKETLKKTQENANDIQIVNEFITKKKRNPVVAVRRSSRSKDAAS